MKDRVKLILIALFNLLGTSFIISNLWYLLGFYKFEIPVDWGYQAGYFNHPFLFIIIVGLIEYLIILASNKIINNKKLYYTVVTIISIMLSILLIIIEKANHCNWNVCLNNPYDSYVLILSRYRFLSLVLNIPTLLAFLTIYLKRRVK